MPKTLKEVLEKHNLSQSWLAGAINLSRATVNLIVNQGKYPTKPDAATVQQAIVAAFKTKNIDVSASLFFEPLTQEELETMLLQKQPVTQETCDYFGLSRSPFDADLNSVDDIFISSAARKARLALWNAACIGGFIAIIGESGSGKTTMRLDFIDRAQREFDGKKIIIVEPSVTRMEDTDIKGKTLKTGDILDAIIYTLSPDSTPKRSIEAKERQAVRLLKESIKAGYHIVLLIEEAHCLPKPATKHLKRLHELRDGFKRLLSVVMIGQPELAIKLSNKSGDIREVTQRCEILALPTLQDDLEGYLVHKFSRVDDYPLDSIFEQGTVEAIARNLTLTGTDYTYPLAVNNLVAAAMAKVAKLDFDTKIKSETIDSFFSFKKGR